MCLVRRAGRPGPVPMLLLSTVLSGVLSGCAEQPQITAITPDPQKAQAPQSGELDRNQIPPPGSNPKLNLPVPERMVLSNGTQVLVVERHTLPVVAMTMVWPVGALEDPADRPGMAYLCADMLDEGAGGYGALELADAFARLGSRLTTRADFNATYVSTLSLSRNFGPTLKLLSDVVQRPALSPKELDRVKADTLTFLKQRHDVLNNVAADIYEQALYGPQHRRNSPFYGTPEAVKLIDHFDLRWWHRERLRPDDATLIIVGDVDTATLKGKLEAELSGWRAPQKRKELPLAAPVPPPTRRIVAVDTPGKSQTVLSIGEPGVPRKHPDYFPLLVMNAILGGQFNSRINMNLREKHGYAYGAFSEFAFSRDAGPFAVRASVKGETAKASVGEVLKEITGLRSGDVPVDELRQAKDLLERSLARRFETVLQVANELSVIEVFKLPDDYLRTYADRVEAVTAADLRRVAQTYLDPSRMTVVLVGDRRDIDKVAELNLGPIQYREMATVPEKAVGQRPPRPGTTRPPGEKLPGKVPSPPPNPN